MDILFLLTLLPRCTSKVVALPSHFVPATTAIELSFVQKCDMMDRVEFVDGA